MIAGLARKQVRSTATQRDTISPSPSPSPSLQNVQAAKSSSRAPSPSLHNLSSSNQSSVPPAQPLLKPRDLSPSRSLQSVPAAAPSSRVLSPSNYSTTTSNHTPVALPLLKSQDRSSTSPSPLLQNPLPARLSASPTPSSSSNHVPISSNRLVQLTKSRESSISPSPLSRVSVSPAPSLQGSASSQSVPIQVNPSRNSTSPTPPFQNLPSAAEDKLSVSPAPSSSQSSASNSDCLKSAVKSKPRDSESPSSPRVAVSHGSLASASSSSIHSLQSHTSLSTSNQQSYLSSSLPPDGDATIPVSKRIKLSSTDSIQSNLSRTPSPQVFSKERVELNGLDSAKLAESGLAGSPASLTTGTQPVRHTIGTQSTGQTGLTTSTQSVLTPAGVPGTTSQQTNVATSLCTDNVPVLSNGTRITLTKQAETKDHSLDDLTNNRDTTHKGDSVQNIAGNDGHITVELSGPLCQWGDCARYYSMVFMYTCGTCLLSLSLSLSPFPSH